MKIFDVDEARAPLASQHTTPYWLRSTARVNEKEITKEKQVIKEILGLKASDQLLLFMHKQYAAKQLFDTILEQKIQESGKIQLLVAKDLDPSVEKAIDELCSQGCMKIKLPTNEFGQIDVEETKKLITFKTSLLTCSYINRKTGVIEPIDEIASLCSQHKIHFHIDADEAIGPIFMDFSAIGCDFLSLNGNTFFGPVGSSLLAIKNDTLTNIGFAPITSNLLTDTAHALKEFHSENKQGFLEIARQRRMFESRMSQELEAKTLFKNTQRSPNITLLQIPAINHESLAFLLYAKHILVGFDRDLNCLKIYFPLDTTYADFESLTNALIECTNKLVQVALKDPHAV